MVAKKPEFSDEPIYKGGARIFITDEREKSSKRSFVQLELRLEKDFSLSRDGNKDNCVLVRAYEPKSKRKHGIVLNVGDFAAVSLGVKDAELAEEAAKLGKWLARGENKPGNDTFVKVLGGILCGSVSVNNRFRIFNDYERTKRLERREGGSRQQEESKYDSSDLEVSNRGARGGEKEESDPVQHAFRTSMKMKQDNRKMAESFKRPVELGYAELAVKVSQNHLKEQVQQLKENEVISQAYESTAWRTVRKMRTAKKTQTKTNRKYKTMINEALDTLELSGNLDAKAKRDKVRHQRELARVKWTPFRNATKWQKGAVIGPGPLPIRKLALMTKTEGNEQQQNKPPTNQHEDDSASSQKVRLQKAFDVLRELARTPDPYYLDFDQAFERLDREEKGFVSMKDLRYMLGGLLMSESDLEMLWNHFDRDRKGFIEKDYLIWGFYNQRTLLKQAQEADESLAFRVGVVERIAIANASKDHQHEAPVRVHLLSLKGSDEANELPGHMYDLFCIVSCCKVVKENGQDTVIIVEERRSEDASGTKKSNDTLHATWENGNHGTVLLRHGTMQSREEEHLLIEVRANDIHAQSDVHSIFLGEIFLPIFELESKTNRRQQWINLNHGNFQGQLELEVEILEGLEDEPTKSPLKQTETEPEMKEMEDYFLREREEAKKLLGDMISRKKYGSHDNEDDEEEYRALGNAANKLLLEMLT